MTIIINDVIKYLEKLYPKHLAYENDPIGLHVGNVNKPLTRVMVTLDVTSQIVKEAIELGANLIVSHHPFLFRPLSSINTNTPKGKVIELCLKHDICIYSMHTNYDIAKNGMNDCLANLLNINNPQPLILTKNEPYSKIAIYTPITHEDIVIHTLGENGAGKIGNYENCTFKSSGIGSFKPLNGSQPFVGDLNRVEQVEEVKIEAIAPTSLVSTLINAVKNVHPYEVMAYDVYTLDITMPDEQYGLGRIGTLKESMTASEYIKAVKQNLNINHARYVGSLNKKIKTVAVIGGSGSSYMTAVKMKKADLFITGDVGFHDGCDALEMGLNVLDVGHHAESVMKEAVAKTLNDYFGSGEKNQFVAFASIISTEPFQFV
ncbi:MAG: Nif3-like dinuclear metal center hexameric protein [Turicibacter sp.]